MSHPQWCLCLATFLTAAGCASGDDGGPRDGGLRLDAQLDGGASECTSDEDCPDDGIFCNGVLECSGGRCIAADVPSCNDGIGCTRDECIATTDECQNTPSNSACPEDTVCYVGHGCAAAAPCEFDSDCGGDGVYCNGEEVCVEGLCASPAGGRDCVDDNSCTIDECVESSGACGNTPYPDFLTNPLHCGTGANDCVPCPDGAAGSHQLATCDMGTCALVCEGGWTDRNGDPADGCEYLCTPTPGLDTPDDAFTDANCDGIDGDRTRAVFVSTRGADTNDGLTPGTPVASFQRAFEVHYLATSRNQILVANGSYATSSTLTVPNGIGIHGGYTDDFLTRADTRASITASSATALRAAGLRSPTVIDRININTTDRTGPSEATYAVVVDDSLDRLSLRFLTITAGRGGDGTSGTAGGRGADGTRGSNASGSSGGAGGNPGGGGASGLGGDGRTGRRRDSGQAGFVGSGGSCGVGGTAGSGSGTGGLGCADGDPGPGGGGGTGCTGTLGGNGSPGDGVGSLAGGVWSPSHGAPGDRGGVGGGGGGGGAGGGEDCTVFGSCTYCGTGRGGGGGGGGGQGGAGGGAGTGGGASIGLVLLSSTVIGHQLRIQTAGGGNGGRGAAGGGGGTGGGGGNGATSSSSTEGNGGPGGIGGPGGQGGCGGGGGGGPSVAVWGNGSSARIRESTPVSYAPGAGGSGGTSCGSSGASGVSSNLRSAFPE